MEFYKLYHVVHDRTDWESLYRWQREEMMPEWYEERRAQARLALCKMNLAAMGIRAVLGDNNYFLQ